MIEDDIQRYEQMLADDPESRAFAPLAEAYRKARRLEDAIRTARAGLEVHPGYSGGLLVLGRALFESRELDPAVEVLQKAVADSPENYLGQKFLGKALRDKGDTQGALRAFEAANFLSPEDEEVALILEEMKKKAEQPRKMEFEAGSARDSGEDRLVTYEQKPTTVDGIELVPLPSEETFSFAPDGEDVTTDPAALRPKRDVKPPVADSVVREAPVATAPVAELTEEVALMEPDEIVIDIPEEDVEEYEGAMDVIQVDDMDDIEEFDPEIVAFIEEGESMAEASLDAGEVAVVPQTEPVTQTEPPVQPPVSFQPPAPPPASPSVSVHTGPAVSPPPAPAEGTAAVAAPGPVTNSPPPAPGSVGTSEPGSPFPEPEPEPAFDLDLGLVTTESVFSSSDLDAMSPAPLDASATGGAISTETLADLYAQQGLTDKALEIYRQILQERPGDEIIELKISALEGTTELPAIESPPSPPRQASPASAGAPPVVSPVVPPTVPGVPEPVPSPESAPVPETVPVMGPASTGAAPAPGDDVTQILGRWLENAERMKRK